MKQLNYITGYWNMGDDHNFNDNNKWEGQLILEDDGWFEGIVNDPNSPYTDDRFIFGAYFPNVPAIELLKVTPAEISAPFAFKCKRNDGRFYVIDELGEQPLGVCGMAIEKSANQDLTELQARINSWKDSISDDENSLLYENTAKMRKEFCEILKRKYTGESFTEEEITEMEKVTRPIEREIMGKISEYLSKIK